MSAFGDLIGPLNFNRHEALNLRLHQFAGSKPDSLAGEVYEDTTIDSPVFVAGSGHLPLLAASEAAPPTLAVGQVASVGTATRGLRADARFGLPGLATTDADGFLSKEDKALLAGATNLANNSTLMRRSGTGTAQVQNPVNNLDAVNLQTLTERLAAASQGISTKDDMRAYSASLPAYTYNGTTKRITANANGVLPAQNGVTLDANDRLLLNNATTQSGLWKVIQVGSVGTPWIMERTEDFGGPTAPAGQRLVGAQTKVLEGNAPYGDSLWLATNDNITIDTTVVVWQKLSKADMDNITLEINAGGFAQIKDQGVANPKLANVATQTIKGRATAGTGAVEDLTATQAWGVIQGVALGETSTTAYRGDRGKTAYDHSQVTNANPHNTAYSQLASIPAAIDAIDGLTPAADRLAYYTGAGSAALTPITAAARGLLDDTDVAAMRSTLGGIQPGAFAVAFRSTSLIWGKVCELKFTGDYGSAAAIFEHFTRGDGSDSAARSRHGRCYVSLKINSTMSGSITAGGLRFRVTWFDDQGAVNTNYELEARIEQDDASEKRVSIWVKMFANSSTGWVAPVAITSGTWATTYAPVSTEPSGTLISPEGAALASGTGKFANLSAGLPLYADANKIVQSEAVSDFRTRIGAAAADGSGQSFKANFGNGTDSTYVIPHGLGTGDLSLTIKEVATNRFVGGGQVTADDTNITIVAGGAVASNAYRVLAWKH